MSQRILREEFQDRIKRLRMRMEERGLQCLIVYSHKRGHVTYLSGYRPDYVANAALVVVPLNHPPILWVKFGFDRERAAELSWFSDIRGCAEATTSCLVGECARALSGLGLSASRIGLVAGDPFVDEMTVSLQESLRAALPQAALVEATDILLQLRLRKSSAEIRNLAEASELAERVAEELSRLIRPGLKVRSAADAVESMARREGADDCFLLLSEKPGKPAVLPTQAEFAREHPVNCEISVRMHGYWVQTCRVFSIGPARDGQREIFRACRNAYEAACEAARPGRSAAEVGEAADQAIRRAGYEPYCYGNGHGVGLDLPEPCTLDRNSRQELFPGLVLVLHPNIWSPPQGAAFVGGPVVVTEGKAICLDRPQQEIIEV